MSLQLAANHLSSQGRGPDSTLVHMSPGEVKSLQQIAMAHGGSLTINPQTGLPEAGFLSSILPMLAGAGLSMIPGVGPLMAAGIVGGGMTAATGSLKKGIMAGLGAYGGAGLGAGLMGAGTQAAADAAISGNLASTVGEPALAATQAAQAAQATPLTTMGQGLTGLATDAGARSGFMTGVGGMKGLLTSGGAALAPMLANMGQQKYQPPAGSTSTVQPYQYSANPITPSPQPNVPGYGNLDRDFGRQNRYFDHKFTQVNPQPASIAPITTMPIINDVGGGMASGGPVEDMSISNVYDMQNARGGVSDMGIDNSTGMQRMAGGGISHLGDYSDGGRLLRGPGDGVSDSIPAMIGAKQPARLADGEFVVPARIVSELGNGSTEAGARKLYAMMDRIQKNRRKTVGKGKVAVNSRSDKLLPA